MVFSASAQMEPDAIVTPDLEIDTEGTEPFIKRLAPSVSRRFLF